MVRLRSTDGNCELVLHNTAFLFKGGNGDDDSIDDDCDVGGGDDNDDEDDIPLI